jgi:hypothetical protein
MCEDCGCDYTTPAGEVTHFFGKPMVVVIKCDQALHNGDEIQIKGSTTEFTMTVGGMRNEAEEEVDHCHTGELCAFKSSETARPGDKVYLYKRETTA